MKQVKMVIDPRIDLLAIEFEKVDTKSYGWTDEQFGRWWNKDPRNINHGKQRARAKLAISFLGEYDGK